MLGIAMYITIETLNKQGLSKIARLTGHDRKTVQKVIKKLTQGQNGPVKKPHRTAHNVVNSKVGRGYSTL